MAPATLTVVGSMDDWKSLTGTDAICIVDFFADWCGPCKAIAPKFAAFSEVYTKIKFLKVNVDEQEDIGEQCGISAMPTFQIWQNGKKLDEMVGATIEKLEAMIKKYSPE